MTIEEFFALIWGQGTGLVVPKKAGTSVFQPAIKLSTIEEVVEKVGELEGYGLEVYHSCGVFADTSRKAADVKSLRSFWLDIDCGEAKGYPTQKDALAALGQFVDELGLPSPYIINSGKGLHVYWPLDKSIRKEQWQPVATALKHATKAEGFKVDQARTADASSILRPVGTTNHKWGKTVTVFREGHITTLGDMTNALSPYINTVDGLPELGATPAHIIGTEAQAIREFPDVYTHEVVSGCGALRAFSESHERISEPKWRSALGILSRCKDGEQYAHEWSARDERYSKQQTQAKLDSWPGPATCNEVSEHWDECQTCPFFGKIKTPLQVKVEVEEIKLVEEDEAVPAPTLPHGFVVMKSNGTYRIFKKTGDPENPYKEYYPAVLYVDSIYEEDGIRYAVVHELGPRGLKEAHVSLTKYTGRDWAQPMFNSLMMINDKNMKFVKEYLQAFTSEHGPSLHTIKAYDNMGWHPDGLLVGERLYKADGTQEVVKVASSAYEYAKGLEPKGSKERWSEIIDTLFNQPGLEHMQFMIACSFASPLLNLMGDEGSILVYGHSPDGGYGKTTAERAALSVWGSWKERSRSLVSTTENAFLNMLSAMSHLPIIYDELTNYDDKKLSQFIHNISSGKPKARLDRNGKPRSMPNTWDLIVCASGNELLSDKLASVKSNASAELSRIFEYTFPDLKPLSKLTATEATVLMQEIEGHVGTAGEVFAKFIVKNRGKIQALLNSTLKNLGVKHQFQGIDRYYARLMAAVIVSVSIANKLGLVKFSRDSLEHFMLTEITRQKDTIQEVSTDPVPKFQEMLGDLMPDILVTIGDENWVASGGEVIIKQSPRSAIKGWFLVPPVAEQRIGIKAANRTRPEFWLIETAVKQWCNKKHLDYKHMIRQWDNAGLISGGPKRARRIGRGLTEYGAMKATMIEVLDKNSVASVTPLTATAVPAI